MYLHLVKEGDLETAQKLLVQTKTGEQSFIIKELLKVKYITEYEEDLTKINWTTQSKIGVKNNKVLEVATWIEEYRDLFNNKGSGKRGDKAACSRKMQTFLQKYPEFADKEVILTATKKYIASQAESDYRFLRQADYFICKNSGDGANTFHIAAYCEEVLIKSNSTPTGYDGRKAV